MIRFKSIREVYPNGLTWVDYEESDFPKQSWYQPIKSLLEFIAEDVGQQGWCIVFSNFLSSCKSSVFYPVITSFEDWNTDYSNGSDIIKYFPQQDAIRKYFFQRDALQAGNPIYPTKSGKGSRWLFTSQMKRVNSYSISDLRNLLQNLAYLGKAIPPADWENSIIYGERIKLFCEDYSAYLKAAYLLPPSWYLIDKLQESSWLKLLIASDILADGTLPTSRGTKCVAKDGHECNSLAELDIDNWLWLHRVNHVREPVYPKHTVHNPNGRLRADFKIGDIWIEYAGLLDDILYLHKMNRKKELASSIGIKLVILEPQDLSSLDDLMEHLGIGNKYRNIKHGKKN